MSGQPGFWELVVAGIAVGGTAVWGVAAAARVGLLRMLLDVFPPSTWDTVTWGLIPLVLLVPPLLQGGVLAWLSGRRPRPVWRAVVGSVLGTLVAMAVFGATLLVGLHHLPPRTLAVVVKTAPDVLIILFILLIVAGWLLVIARAARRADLGRVAVLAVAVAVAVAWQRDHGQIVALSYVLDRPEANGFFASVAVGGALGTVWAVRRVRGEAV